MKINVLNIKCDLLSKNVVGDLPVLSQHALHSMLIQILLFMIVLCFR